MRFHRGKRPLRISRQQWNSKTLAVTPCYNIGDMKDMNRRGFLASGIVTAVAAPRPAFSQTAISRTRVAGANERVRVGLIGCGGRGSADLKTFLGVPGTECTALCDPDQARSARALKTIVEPLSQRPGVVTGDFRRVLESKNVDAVIVATPDHWHALAATLACQSGKDVYLEKPLSLTIAEGTRCGIRRGAL